MNGNYRHREAPAGRSGPDTMAVFAIGSAPAGTGGYRGSSPREITDTLPDLGAQEALSSLTSEYSAHNYHPLSVVVSSAAGCWVTGVDGRRYLDMLAGYSALNF